LQRDYFSQISAAKKKGGGHEKETKMDSRTKSINKLESLSTDASTLTKHHEMESICNDARDVLNCRSYHWQMEAWEVIFGKQQDIIIIAVIGSGKSLIFQSLHFVRAGAVNSVISPLVGLIIDQILHLILNLILIFCLSCLT
jgi:ATP-dependent helicase YprA (DUF1998 family)